METSVGWERASCYRKFVQRNKGLESGLPTFLFGGAAATSRCGTVSRYCRSTCEERW